MKWDENGAPRDLEAAAADALMWLDTLNTLEAMTRTGRARFVLNKLSAARSELARFLPLEARSIRAPEEMP